MFILYFCIRIRICIRFGNTNKQPDEPMEKREKTQQPKQNR